MSSRACVSPLLSALVFAVSPFAAGQTTPIRAAGLWELKHVGGGGTVIGTQTLCVSAASEARVSLFGQIALNVNCSKYAVAKAGENWTFDFVCGPSAMRSTSKGTVSGDFTSAYQVEMTESDGTMELARTIQATHQGTCPAGVAPGTLRDETGKTVTNILD
jgi:hypothetical protein